MAKQITAKTYADLAIASEKGYTVEVDSTAYRFAFRRNATGRRQQLVEQFIIGDDSESIAVYDSTLDISSYNLVITRT